MRVRALLKRLRADRLLATVALIMTVTTLALLAAGPIYADAVSLAALRQKLGSAPASENSILVSVAGPTGLYATVDDHFTRTLDSTLGPVGSPPVRTLTSRSFGFTETGETDETAQTDVAAADAASEKLDLAVFRHLEGMERHVDITAGRWPGDRQDAVEVAIGDNAAKSLGIKVGDAVDLVARGPSDDRVIASVVGRYKPNDSSDSFWLGQDALVTGTTETRTFRTVSLVTTEQGIVEAAGGRFDAQWTIQPDFDLLELAHVNSLYGRLDQLEPRLVDALADATDGSNNTFSPITARTAIPELLAGSSRSVTVTRSGVFAIVLQLSVLAGYSLYLLAGLLVATREGESAVQRARGASPTQAAAQSAIEASALVVPAWLAAPWLAVWGVGLLDDVGPLAAGGLKLEPVVTMRAVLVATIAAAVTIVLLIWPPYRAARQKDQTRSLFARQRSRSAGQRIGADLAFVAIAAGLLWQLASLGSDRTDVIRGRFGVDPLLLLVPAVTMGAGALISLRIVPLLVRGAEHFVGVTRSAIAALVSWQFARRPVRYAQASLLLILAVAMASFATIYHATWTRSQHDQGAHEVGADLRVQPNRREGDSIPDLYLTPAHETIAGVAHSIAVNRTGGPLVNSERSGAFITLDAARAALVVNARADIRPAIHQAFATLLAERPSMASLPIQGEPDRLTLDLDAVEDVVLDSDGEPRPVRFAGSGFLVLQDSNSMLHRVPLGDFVSNAGPVALTADLSVTATDGQVFAPAYPVSIVDIELRFVASPGTLGEVAVDLVRLRSTEDGQDSGVLSDLASPSWRTSLDSQGLLDRQATVANGSSQPIDGRRLVLELGRADQVVPVLLSLRPVGSSRARSTPVIVSERWLEASNAEIGDTFVLEGQTGLIDRGEIVGTVPRFPTVDPDRNEIILADLATVQITNYRLGRSIPTVDEYWLSVDESASDGLSASATSPDADVARQLLAAPVESADVVWLSRRTQELVGDPPALGLLGVLALGAVAAAVFAILGVFVSFVVSVRERSSEFALLRSLGLTPRQLNQWIHAERALLVGPAILIGGLLGFAMSAVVLPLISLTQEGAAVTPTPDVVYPWSTIGLVVLAIVGPLGLLSVLVHTRRSRASLADVLRAGSV